MAEKIYNIGSVKSVRGDPEFTKGFFDGSLTEVKAETYEGATKIGDYILFNASLVNTFEIPDSVESIGSNSITGMSKLKELIIPKNVKSIGENSLNNSSLTSIRIDNPDIEIGKGSLSGISSSAYTIYESLGYLPYEDNPYYFLTKSNQSSSDTSVVIHKDVMNIAEGFLYNNFSMYYYTKSLEFESGCKLKKLPERFAYNSSKLTTITLPESLEEIGGNCFNGCSSLTSLDFFPESLRIINDSAFSGCSKATKIDLPLNLDKVGKDAFSACSAVSEINLNSKNISSFGTDVFRNMTKTPITINIGENVEKIPNNFLKAGTSKSYQPSIASFNINENAKIKEIGENAFYQFKYTGDIQFPDTLTNIGTHAFQESNISSFSTEGNVEIGNGAFYQSNLTTVSIPNVISIGDGAFQDCTNLTNIEVGNNLKSVRWQAFVNTKITSFTFPESIEEIGSSIFHNNNNISLINYNVASLEQCSLGITAKNVVFNIGDNVLRIPNYIFSGAKEGIINFSENSNCNTIGEYAFRESTFTSLKLPSTIENIEYRAFYKATLPEDFNLEATNIKTIKKGTFEEASGQITLPESLEEIETNAFHFSDISGTLNIPKNVSKIGATAFFAMVNIDTINYNAKNCTSDVDRPQFFNRIGENRSTVVLNILDDVEEIQDNLFYVGSSVQSPKITEIIFSENCKCTTIGDWAFQGFKHLKKITLSKNIKTLGEAVFYDAKVLEEIRFNGTISEWKNITKGSSILGGAPDTNMNVICTDGSTPFYDF